MLSPELPNLTIRPILPSDAAEYYPLRLRALREHPEAFSSSYEEQAGLGLEAFASRYMEAPTPDRFMLGAWLGGALVGNLALFRASGVKIRHTAELVRMYVAPEARRQGVGWALVEAALGRARKLPGLEQVSLEVMAENREAIGLYRKAGFANTGLIPRAIKVGERYFDYLIMQLVLD